MLRALMRIGIVNVEFNLKLAEKTHCSEVNIIFFFQLDSSLDYNMRDSIWYIPFAEKVHIESDL